MDKEAEERTREFVEELDRELRERMRRALYAFCMDPEDMRKRQAVLDQVMSACLYNTVCFTTGSINDQMVFCPDRVYVPECSGYAYTVYTEKTDENSLGKVLFHLSWRDLLRMAVKTEGIVGIQVNPVANHPVLLITRQDLENIIRTADEEIQKHNAAMEEDLKKYQVWDPKD